MKFKWKTLIIPCMVAIGTISCARHANVPAQISYHPTPFISDLDSLFPSSEINLSFYRPQPVEIYKPAPQISEHFIGAERYIVKFTDQNFIDRKQELIIDFSQLTDDAFCFPLPGARVISPYGTARGRNHEGIDIKINRHDTILAAFDGIVRISSTARGYGNVIVVRHYNGLETVYGHNSKRLVKSGDRVKAGQVLAVSGQTGRASTDHLHFEVRVNGKHIDPNLIIDFEKQTLLQKCLVFTSDKKGKLNIEQV